MEYQKNWQEQLTELGKKIKNYRIAVGMSQQDLSDASGVSSRSISRLEQGQSVQTDNLFRILESLRLGNNIDMLVPDQSKRPSYYLFEEKDRPKRVRKKKIRKNTFKWGDEQ